MINFVGLRVVFFFFFLGIQSLFSVAIASELIVANKGIYEVKEKSEVFFGKESFISVTDYELVKEVETIPALIGKVLGFELLSTDENDIYTDLKISFIGTNSLGVSLKKNRYKIPIRVAPGGKYFIGWKLTPKDLQPGEWVFEFGFPNSPLCQFNTVKADEVIAQEKETGFVTNGMALSDEVIITRYLVREGIYSEFELAEERAEELKKIGYSPFIFIREREKRQYVYHLFTGVYDSKELAAKNMASFATKCNVKANIEVVSLDCSSGK